MSRPTPRRRATRSRILEAAARVFARRGYEEATVADLLEAADVSRRTFYQHFSGKVGALLALGRVGLAQDVAEARAHLEAGEAPLALLRASLEKDAAWFQEHPELARPLVQEALRGDLVSPPSGEGSHRALYLLLIDAAQEAGTLRDDVPPEELALLLAGALGTSVLAWSRSPEVPLQARLARLMDIVLEGARR